MKQEVEVMKKKLNNMRRDFYLQNPEERKEQPSKQVSEPSGQSPIKSFEEEFEDFSAKNIREEQSSFEEQTFRQIFSARKPKASEELEETPRDETNDYMKQGSGVGGGASPKQPFSDDGPTDDIRFRMAKAYVPPGSAMATGMSTPPLSEKIII